MRTLCLLVLSTASSLLFSCKSDDIQPNSAKPEINAEIPPKAQTLGEMKLDSLTAWAKTQLADSPTNYDLDSADVEIKYGNYPVTVDTTLFGEKELANFSVGGLKKTWDRTQIWDEKPFKTYSLVRSLRNWSNGKKTAMSLEAWGRSPYADHSIPDYVYQVVIRVAITSPDGVFCYLFEITYTRWPGKTNTSQSVS